MISMSEANARVASKGPIGNYVHKSPCSAKSIFNCLPLLWVLRRPTTLADAFSHSHALSLAIPSPLSASSTDGEICIIMLIFIE
jgi:hypothetical protein